MTSAVTPRVAMVLAAGLGLRLRPITEQIPKPLVQVAGRTLLDHNLDRLAAGGITRAVVNTHYLSDQIESHLKNRRDLEIILSPEIEERLDTGGGIYHAIDHLGPAPFYSTNTDVIWLDGPTPALRRLATAWDDDRMDGLLLLHSTVESYGYTGDGDFLIDPNGVLTRRPEREVSPYLFTGTQLLHPRLFKDVPAGAFSLNLLYDRAMAEGRLYGLIHDGDWFHIGTPDGLHEAETYMRQRFPGMRHR